MKTLSTENMIPMIPLGRSKSTIPGMDNSSHYVHQNVIEFELQELHTFSRHKESHDLLIKHSVPIPDSTW